MLLKEDIGASLRSRYAGDGGSQAIFTDKVADYIASRPDYAAALFDTLRSICPPGKNTTVADVGAGTGLLTRDLLRAGYNVVAVEPNTAMRQAADVLLGQNEHYRSVDGSAESTSLAAASVQLITVAQAFHWFDVEQTQKEFLRVLDVTGKIALIWNDRISEEPIHVTLDELFREFGGEKRAAIVVHEERKYVPHFFGSCSPQQFSWPHEQSLSLDGLVSLVFSRSYIPAKNTSTGNQLTKRLEQIFRQFEINGVVKIPYRTMAFIGRPIG